MRCKVKWGLSPFFNMFPLMSPYLNFFPWPLALQGNGELGVVCPRCFFLFRVSPCCTEGFLQAVRDSLSTFSSLSWSFSSLYCVQSLFLILCSSLSAAMQHLKPFWNLLLQRHHHFGCWAQLCPVAKTACVWHRAAPTSLLAPGHAVTLTQCIFFILSP